MFSQRIFPANTLLLFSLSPNPLDLIPKLCFFHRNTSSRARERSWLHVVITAVAIQPPVHVDFLLISYKAYDPPRFLQFDRVNGSRTFVESGLIGIKGTVRKEDLV